MIPRLNVHFPISALMQKKQTVSALSENSFFLNHARTGISTALLALNLPPKSKVGVMTFNCHTVMNAVHTLGLDIVFIDVDKSLRLDINDLSKKAEGLSALIISHLFGIPSDVKRVKELYPHVIIIEDCAHALLSQFPNNTLTGTEGYFAVFSTGLGKFPSVGDGGILTVNNEKYLPAVTHLVNKLPKSTIRDDVKIIIKGLINNLLYTPRVYSLVTLKLKNKNKKNILKKIKKQAAPKQMARIIKKLSDKEFSKLNDYKIIQQNNARFLTDDFLPQIKGSFPIDCALYRYSNCFMLPVWCEDKSAFIQTMRERGIESATHFESAIAWAYKFGYQEKTSPMSEKIIEHLVMIPCHYNLSLKKLQYYLK